MYTDKIQINNRFFSLEEIQYKIQNEKLHDWDKGIYEFILNWFSEFDFILQQTSGSTGKPKEIKLKKSAMIASAKRTIRFFGLKENDTSWLCLPINYIAGKMMVVRAIIGSLNLIIAEPEGMPQIPVQEINFTAMVPMQVQNLLNANANFNPIKKLIIGGAATDSTLLEKLQNISTEVYATYGMTETCSHIALQRLNGKHSEKNFKLLPNISIRQNNESCLVIDAPDLSENSIETSDVVEIISDREFKILGRADNIINSGGIKISPEQLENEISKILKKDFLIVPEKDDLLGQKIVLVLEGKKDKSLAEEILNKLKSNLSKHHTPKAVYFINEFPRNASMKIDRKKVIKLLVINQ